MDVHRIRARIVRVRLPQLRTDPFRHCNFRLRPGRHEQTLPHQSHLLYLILNTSSLLSLSMVLEPPTGRWRRFYQAPEPFERASVLYLAFSHPLKLLLLKLYHVLTYFRTAPAPSAPPVRVVCISDTHELTCEVPQGDVLIFAGDLTNCGSVQAIQKQVDWLASLPHQHIVVIAGNHDSYLDPRSRGSLAESQRAGSVDWKRVHYLQHCSKTLNVAVQRSESHSRDPLLRSGIRTLRVYGAPQIPACGPMSQFAFQYPRGLDAWSETVPEDTDVLVTHTPPKSHLDLPLPDGQGCEYLLAEVKRVRPALHVFGHVHWGAGSTVCWWGHCQEAYERGMGVKTGWARGLLSHVLWRSIIGVVCSGVKELVWDKIWGGQGRSTVMVNAAQMKGNTGKLGNTVQVVVI